jgi:hypothetical protein
MQVEARRERCADVDTRIATGKSTLRDDLRT